MNPRRYARRGFYLFREAYSRKAMLNENIKLLREYNALDIDQLAFALKIGEEDYFTFENGAVVPQTRELERIAKVYNITMDQLFFGLNRFGKPLCQSESADEYYKNLTQNSFLSKLSKREQNIIIAYRLCENKNEAYDKIHSVLSYIDEESKP